MKKWEYKIVALKTLSSLEDRERILNKFGEEGWELVNIDHPVAYFKREIKMIEMIKSDNENN
jgi:hypothetical protein